MESWNAAKQRYSKYVALSVDEVCNHDNKTSCEGTLSQNAFPYYLGAEITRPFNGAWNLFSPNYYLLLGSCIESRS